MMTDKEIAALFFEWKELLKRQRHIIFNRGKGVYFDGLIGILVADDALAHDYQDIQSRIWEIKGMLFGDYYVGA